MSNADVSSADISNASSRLGSQRWQSLPVPVRKSAVALAGTSIALAGIVLLVLPGPGIPLLILGLAVLSTEFTWAKRALGYVQTRATSAAALMRARWRRGRSRGLRRQQEQQVVASSAE